MDVVMMVMMVGESAFGQCEHHVVVVVSIDGRFFFFSIEK